MASDDCGCDYERDGDERAYCNESVEPNGLAEVNDHPQEAKRDGYR